jgi:hypothetical protein
VVFAVIVKARHMTTHLSNAVLTKHGQKIIKSKEISKTKILPNTGGSHL